MHFYNEVVDSGSYSIDSPPPMPDGTVIKAFIEEARTIQNENISKSTGEHESIPAIIKLKWHVAEGEFEKRKITQKLKVFDPDPDVSDRAHRMMAAIDFNCGGHLCALGKYPEDEYLHGSLVDCPMYIVLSVWEMGDKKGNWIRAVHSISNDPESLETNEVEPF